jgi:hypothetical protein
MSKDYRKIYEKYFGKIPEGCQIHHIDGNRKNNKLNNLVAIDTGVHRRFHALLFDVNLWVCHMYKTNSNYKWTELCIYSLKEKSTLLATYMDIINRHTKNLFELIKEKDLITEYMNGVI